MELNRLLHMRNLYFLIVMLGLAACASKQKADLIIYCKTAYVADSSFSSFNAIAVKDGKVLEAGDSNTIASKYESDSVLDLSDKYLYPGFIDAHCHFSGYALSLYKCDLVGTQSFKEIIAKLKAYDQNNPLKWIYGRGWDQNDWAVKEFPTKDSLDKLFPNKPVILKRIDGHALLCNQKALDMAGITAKTVISGGIIEKKKGKLTGILIDNAMTPVEKLIPLIPEDIGLEYLKKAEQECYSLGLTGVVDCGVETEVIKRLQKLYKSNELSIAIALLLSSDSATLAAFVKQGPFGEGQFSVPGIKLYADGALGSRGACLLHDYADMPRHKGMLLSSVADMKKIAEDAKKYNWQLCTHAIGDSANRTILQLYSEFLKGTNDKRWRIEHAQVVNPADHHYFREYSVIPSVQPTHAISDMPWAGTRLGKERLPHAYAYKELLNEAGNVALGTDFPVEAINPLGTFYTAVVRKDASGHPKEGFMMNNALSRKEALLGMTAWAARSVFWEKNKGSIEAGKDADFIILDKDIMTMPAEEILKTKVIYTLVKGKVKYKAAVPNEVSNTIQNQ